MTDHRHHVIRAGIILLAALTVPAAAQDAVPLPPEKPPAIQALLPPDKYDRPFRGFLKLQREEDEETLLWACEGRLACYFRRDLCDGMPECPHPNDLRWRFRCNIVMGSDEIIRAWGHNPIVVYRHEMGHCNGWPEDHPGARVVPPGPMPAMWRREWAAQLRRLKETARAQEEAAKKEAEAPKKEAEEAAKADAKAWEDMLRLHETGAATREWLLQHRNRR